MSNKNLKQLIHDQLAAIALRKRRQKALTDIRKIVYFDGHKQAVTDPKAYMKRLEEAGMFDEELNLFQYMNTEDDALLMQAKRQVEEYQSAVVEIEAQKKQQAAEDISKPVEDLSLEDEFLAFMATQPAATTMVEGTEVKHLGYDFDNMDFYKRFLDGVGWTESRSTGMAADTKQVGGGDARGFLQVEGGSGSRRNETMLTRARNYYALYPDSPTNEEIAFLIQQEDKDIDFSTLSKETQKLLFYIDGAMHKDLSLGDLATGKLPEEWAYARFWQRGKDLEKAANTYDTAQQTNPNRLEEQKPPDE